MERKRGRSPMRPQGRLSDGSDRGGRKRWRGGGYFYFMFYLFYEVVLIMNTSDSGLNHGLLVVVIRFIFFLHSLQAWLNLCQHLKRNFFFFFFFF
jgi:hypothetical protein